MPSKSGSLKPKYGLKSFIYEFIFGHDDSSTYFPPICQNPLNPSPYINLTIKNPRAYRQLLQSLQPTKRSRHANSIIISGGLQSRYRRPPSWKSIFLPDDYFATNQPLLPSSSTSSSSPKQTPKPTQESVRLIIYGDYHTSRDCINIYPDSHLDDHLLSFSRFPKQLDPAKLARSLKPELILTLLEELAHSYQNIHRFHISHPKHLSTSRIDQINLLRHLATAATILIAIYI